MNNKILIIGGNGFIGRNLVIRALSLGWNVTSLSLTGLGPGAVTRISADITDFSSLSAALNNVKYNYIVNCGGYVDHTFFKYGGSKVIESHFGGVVNLATIIDRTELKKFINIGSSDEYGNSSAPQLEDTRESPISPYSLGKLASSQFLQMLYRTENFPAITLRLFLTYGPGQTDKRFIPSIIKGCLSNASFPVSLGQQLRDFCFIDDVVDAVFAALTSNVGNGEVFNVGSGEPVSIESVINKIRLIIGKGNPIFGAIPYRVGESMSLYADTQKINETLGWSSKINLSEGLARTIPFYKKSFYG
jgi:nucleoside-diphosphate-sugar epimerase